MFYRLLLFLIFIVFLGCGSDRADRASIDSDRDGLSDRAEAVLGTSARSDDSDGDGIKDFDEANSDSDGDGINDALESMLEDSDHDGVVDQFDSDNSNPTNDSDEDGVSNQHEILAGTNPLDSYDTPDVTHDRDNDNLPNGIDPNDNNMDSDGDGILDGADADVNGDGINDNGIDSDNDGINDSSDADVDGDGIVDNGADNDGDGVNDEYDLDDDNDGLLDSNDFNSINPDSDGDGILDGVDADVNGDGINDNGSDSDGDGITNRADADVDGDGVIDNGADNDGDGVNDEYDLDDDNDGIVDTQERALDSDGDGIDDSLESNIIDSDGDGVTNQLDSEDSNPNNDSDGDGQANRVELTCGDIGNPLDANKRCPWAIEGSQAEALKEAGFIYVPGGFDVDGDGTLEKGFWVSAYQARGSGRVISIEDMIATVGNYRAFIADNFKLVNSNEPISIYRDGYLTDTTKGEEVTFNYDIATSSKRLSSLAPYQIMVSLKHYRGVESAVTLMSQKQYAQIALLLKADLDNVGDGTYLRNGLIEEDFNIPRDYHSKIYEFDTQHKEFLKDLMWLKDKSENSKFSLEDVQSWWGVDIDRLYYNYPTYGANSDLDVGIGRGATKDNYAVIVRAGSILDLLQGTTGGESDSSNRTNGIGFRGAINYLP